MKVHPNFRNLRRVDRAFSDDSTDLRLSPPNFDCLVLAGTSKRLPVMAEGNGIN